jgi:dolichol kinase
VITIALALQLAASASTIIGSWLYGNKSIWGPVTGLVSQVFWWSIMFQSSLWGLWPVNVMMLIIHARNYWKWKKA